jgi:DNA polymerase-1
MMDRRASADLDRYLTRSDVDSRPVFDGDHVLLIDGSAMLYRAFHSQTKDLRRQSDNMPTGALYGVTQALWFMLMAPRDCGGPATHGLVCFDTPARTHRHDLLEAYKSHRSAAPSDLDAQRPLVNEAIEAFGLRHVRADGWEADDLIATYARRAENAGARVSIIGNDKDLVQLVDDNITVRYRDKGAWRTMDDAAVRQRWGVTPPLIPDLLALADDAVDGVRGIPGIGIGIGMDLIARFGSLEGVLQNATRGKVPGLGPSRQQAIANYGNRARLARQLILLREDAPMPVPLEDCAVDVDPLRVIEFCEKAEFPTFAQRVREWEPSSADRGSR